VCTFAFFFVFFVSEDNVIKGEGVDDYRVICGNLFGYCLDQEIKNTYVVFRCCGGRVTVHAAGLGNAASI